MLYMYSRGKQELEAHQVRCRPHGIESALYRPRHHEQPRATKRGKTEMAPPQGSSKEKKPWLQKAEGTRDAKKIREMLKDASPNFITAKFRGRGTSKNVERRSELVDRICGPDSSRSDRLVTERDLGRRLTTMRHYVNRKHQERQADGTLERQYVFDVTQVTLYAYGRRLKTEDMSFFNLLYGARYPKPAAFEERKVATGIVLERMEPMKDRPYAVLRVKVQSRSPSTRDMRIPFPKDIIRTTRVDRRNRFASHDLTILHVIDEGEQRLQLQVTRVPHPRGPSANYQARRPWRCRRTLSNQQKRYRGSEQIEGEKDTRTRILPARASITAEEQEKL